MAAIKVRGLRQSLRFHRRGFRTRLLGSGDHDMSCRCWLFLLHPTWTAGSMQQSIPVLLPFSVRPGSSQNAWPRSKHRRADRLDTARDSCLTSRTNTAREGEGSPTLCETLDMLLLPCSPLATTRYNVLNLLGPLYRPVLEWETLRIFLGTRRGDFKEKNIFCFLLASLHSQRVRTHERRRHSSACCILEMAS